MDRGPMIYISYAEADKDIAARLYRDLKNAGAVPWMTEEDLLPGQNRELEIRQAIRRSDIILTLISSRSANRQGFEHKELKMALDILDTLPESDIFIIPVRVDTCDIPYRIEHLYPTDLFPSYQEGLNKIIKALQAKGLDADIQPAPAPDPHPRPADITSSSSAPSQRATRLDGIEKRTTPETRMAEETAPGRTEGARDQEAADSPSTSGIGKKQVDVKQGGDTGGNDRTGYVDDDAERRSGWIPIVSVTSALTFIVLLMAVALFMPHPTEFQIFVFRIVLALSAAAFGATVPGFFNIRIPVGVKGIVHAGGALGLFVLIFMVNPPALILTDDKQPDQIVTQSISGTVLDVRNEPLPGVLVTLPELDKLTRTQTQGRFSFDIEIAKGAMVRIMAEKEGYKTFRRDVMAGSTGHTFKMEK